MMSLIFNPDLTVFRNVSQTGVNKVCNTTCRQKDKAQGTGTFWQLIQMSVMFMLAIIIIESDNVLLQGKSFDHCLFSVHNEELSYKSRTQDYSERFVDRHLHDVQAERQTTRYWQDSHSDWKTSKNGKSRKSPLILNSLEKSGKITQDTENVRELQSNAICYFS